MMESDDAVDSQHVIRCPHCGKTRAVGQYERACPTTLRRDDGICRVECFNCGEHFEIEVVACYTYLSPRRVKHG